MKGQNIHIPSTSAKKKKDIKEKWEKVESKNEKREKNKKEAAKKYHVVR